MSAPLKIFITGATGYIGGSVLGRLLQHKDAALFKITALVRTEEKGNKLKALGVDFIVGSYTDADLSFLTDEAAQSDVVFTMADADQLPPTQAILKGLKMRYEKSGKAPILIHTSGTGLLTDNALGLTSEHITYSDLDVEKLKALPDSALHKNVDAPIIEADKSGYVKSYIVAPSTIAGQPSGPLVDHGIQNTTSLLFSFFIKPVVGPGSRRQGGYFGKGVNRWNAVSVDEVTNFYILLFDTLRKSPEIPSHGVEGYYFLESCIFSYKQVAITVSETLFDLGVGNSKEASAFTQEEIDALYGPYWWILAANSYAKGDRSRALGWNPQSTTTDFLENLREELKAFLAESK